MFDPAKLGSQLHDTNAAALIELAIALPLLIVLVVGIFDFGGAYNLKQRLNNAVRDGARFALEQPTNDLGNGLAIGTPPTVDAVRVLVDSYLQTSKINDCGLSSATATQGPPLAWSYSASGSGCSLILTINRALSVQTTTTPPVHILCTTVSISYGYQWHFNSVIQLIAPGANYSLANIKNDATAVNMN